MVSDSWSIKVQTNSSHLHNIFKHAVFPTVGTYIKFLFHIFNVMGNYFWPTMFTKFPSQTSEKAPIFIAAYVTYSHETYCVLLYHDSSFNLSILQFSSSYLHILYERVSGDRSQAISVHVTLCNTTITLHYKLSTLLFTFTTRKCLF